MLANNAVMTMTPKGERTKAVILDTAINLFKERGFEQTTMRAIAARQSSVVTRSPSAYAPGR